MSLVPLPTARAPLEFLVFDPPRTSNTRQIFIFVSSTYAMSQTPQT